MRDFRGELRELPANAPKSTAALPVQQSRPLTSANHNHSSRPPASAAQPADERKPVAQTLTAFEPQATVPSKHVLAPLPDASTGPGNLTHSLSGNTLQLSCTDGRVSGRTAGVGYARAPGTEKDDIQIHIGRNGGAP